MVSISFVWPPEPRTTSSEAGVIRRGSWMLPGGDTLALVMRLGRTT